MVIPDTPLSGIEPGIPLKTAKLKTVVSVDSNVNAIEKSGEINKLVWEQPQKPFYTTISAPDLVLEEKPSIIQNSEEGLQMDELDWSSDDKEQQSSFIISRLEELITEATKSSVTAGQNLMDQNENPEEVLDQKQKQVDQQDALTMVGEITAQRWLIKITLIINRDLKIDATPLFDMGADENYINEEIIPTRFYEKTTESLSSVSGTKLDIRYKLSQVEVEQNRVRHCKNQPSCGKNPCQDHINRTLKTMDDYELVIGHLILQEPLPDSPQLPEVNCRLILRKWGGFPSTAGALSLSD
ncbi:hypothetical protein CRG98_038165 [Punica granatum]|uniref:Peptidase A2 domain-containing protein n=1 Tax=Punica granatum TaxID=22663 RepID=A0A2I0IBT0_PUNGR|nr:hypothetical protein CRG98_038165 [Punica granatum]